MLRKKKIEEYPMCEICERSGKTTFAEEVHHIMPIEKGRNREEMTRRAFEYNNLQSLCKECHDKVHKRGFEYVHPRVHNKKKTKNFIDKFL